MGRVRNRQRLRRKEVAEYAAAIESMFGCVLFGPEENVDIAEAGDSRLLLVDGKALAFVSGARAIPTVRGLLVSNPTKRFVTVDMGAVKFVYNGADVMAPGIVEADPRTAVGDFVWVRDERNRRPLAVGEALMSGPEMVAAKKGKAVKSIHHVGDDIWKLDEES